MSYRENQGHTHVSNASPLLSVRLASTFHAFCSSTGAPCLGDVVGRLILLLLVRYLITFSIGAGMASNVLPGVSTAWRGGSAPWGRRHLPLSPAAQVGGADHTLAHASPEGSESATSVDSIPPYNAAVAAAAAAAIGSSHLQQQPMYLPPNPYFPNANGVVGSPTETSNDRGRVVGNSHDHHCNALRLILLEAEVKSAKTHNLHLQHNMAFLQTQNSGQLGHIASLHAKIRALESELTSLKATNEVVGANSAPATSVPPNTTPPSAPAPAVLGPPLPDQHQPVPHGPAKPGISGNDDLWDLRPKSSCGSVAASGAATEAATEAEPGGSSAAPSGSAAAALLVVSPENQISPAAAATEGIPSAFNDTQVTRSGDSTTTESSSAGPAVAQGENDSSSNDGSAESGGCVETELGVGVNTAPVVTTPKRTRNSLKDFWADSNLNIDDSPPASNTRNHRHRGELVAPATEDRIFTLKIPSHVGYHPCNRCHRPASPHSASLTKT